MKVGRSFIVDVISLGLTLLLAELTSLLWSVVSLISLRVNMAANSVATNVTTDFQIHSYVAVGPFWLRSLLDMGVASV